MAVASCSKAALLALAVAALPVLRADVCAGKDFEGPYGFQLSGSSTISGEPSPTASVGRLVFDGAGKLSGYSSVNFNGYFLGNPVTGAYEIRSDCTVVWSLQDDSGGYQHFSGRATPDGAKIDFHQSDPGSGVRGTMERVATGCTAAGIHGRFGFVLGGISTPFAQSGTRVIAEKAAIDADGAGGFTLSQDGMRFHGTYDVDGDCFAQISYGDTKLRGILVRGGEEILVMQTDPKVSAAGRLTKIQPAQ